MQQYILCISVKKSNIFRAEITGNLYQQYRVIHQIPTVRSSTDLNT